MYGAWIALGQKYCRACSANAIQHVVVVITKTPPVSNHAATSLRMKSRSTEPRMATAANTHPAMHASSGASIRVPLEDSGMRRPQNRLIARTDHEDIGIATTNATTRAAALSGANEVGNQWNTDGRKEDRQAHDEGRPQGRWLYVFDLH